MLSAALERMVVSPAAQRERAKALKRKFLPTREFPTQEPLSVCIETPSPPKPITVAKYQLNYNRMPDAWGLARGPKAKFPSVLEIRKTVGDYFGISPTEMLASRRLEATSRARQIAMYLAKELTPLSFPQIGRHIGGKDHSTIIHGCRKIRRLLEVDEKLQADIEALRKTLEG